ncbi:hypothetical protein K7432_013927 [Basidiobolus ranarum]|uniref:Uncharacterized protein n=1 Tax=Basidiobolus ranarum TaxID=34480 RepID=A0ABR2WIF5_9FUNG
MSAVRASGKPVELVVLLTIAGAGFFGSLGFMGWKLSTDTSLRRFRSPQAPNLFRSRP